MVAHVLPHESCGHWRKVPQHAGRCSNAVAKDEGVRQTTTPPVVLVVEDEWMLREAIAQELRGAGCEVLEARTAEEAIACVHANGRIDAVFTDIQLGGGLDGWDVAEQVRAVHADVGIIYASGNAADRSRRVADSHFFDKPYDPAAVVAACRHHAQSRPSPTADGPTRHYFLHIRNGAADVIDPEGEEFADLASAKAAAIQGARELISQCVLAGMPMGLHRVFEIVDGNGNALATVPFSEAVVN